MFNVRLNSVITMLVDHSLNRSLSPKWNNDGTITREGICVQVRLSADKYEKPRKNECQIIYILFCGNTSVFWVPAYDENGDFAHTPGGVPCDKWVNTSNHDSCWRSDGLNFLDTLYFEFCNRVNPKIAPIQVDTSADFFWSWPISKVAITYKNDGDYRNKIVGLSLLK